MTNATEISSAPASTPVLSSITTTSVAAATSAVTTDSNALSNPTLTSVLSSTTSTANGAVIPAVSTNTSVPADPTPTSSSTPEAGGVMGTITSSSTLSRDSTAPSSLSSGSAAVTTSKKASDGIGPGQNMNAVVSTSTDGKGAKPAAPSTGTSVPIPKATLGTGGAVTNGLGKAGLSWNGHAGTRWDQFTKISGSQVGWTYNWASSRNDGDKNPRGLNYVPMLHGKAVAQEDKPALFEANKSKFKEWGVTHILSFNEPDQPATAGGSQMTIDETVQLHQKHFPPELASQYKIGGPAYSQGKLDGLKASSYIYDWETKCAGACAFDFVNLHFYGTNKKDLEAYLDDAEQKFPGKPLWMTEIGCINYGVNPIRYPSDDEVKSFMKDVLPILHKRTERYAWQGSFATVTSPSGGDYVPLGSAPPDRNNMMDPGSFELNEKGKIFATTI